MVIYSLFIRIEGLLCLIYLHNNGLTDIVYTSQLFYTPYLCIVHFGKEKGQAVVERLLLFRMRWVSEIKLRGSVESARWNICGLRRSTPLFYIL